MARLTDERPAGLEQARIQLKGCAQLVPTLVPILVPTLVSTLAPTLVLLGELEVAGMGESGKLEPRRVGCVAEQGSAHSHGHPLERRLGLKLGPARLRLICLAPSWRAYERMHVMLQNGPARTVLWNARAEVQSLLYELCVHSAPLVREEYIEHYKALRSEVVWCLADTLGRRGCDRGRAGGATATRASFSFHDHDNADMYRRAKRPATRPATRQATRQATQPAKRHGPRRAGPVRKHTLLDAHAVYEPARWSMGQARVSAFELWRAGDALFRLNARER